MAKPKPRTRNLAAQDSTLLNIRALKKRIARLEEFRGTAIDNINAQAKAVLKLEVQMKAFGVDHEDTKIRVFNIEQRLGVVN